MKENCGTPQDCTCKDRKVLSVIRIPPRSRRLRFVSEEMSITPLSVNLVPDNRSFSKLWMVTICLRPASEIFAHLDKSNSFNVFIPKATRNKEFRLQVLSMTTRNHGVIISSPRRKLQPSASYQRVTRWRHCQRSCSPPA